MASVFLADGGEVLCDLEDLKILSGFRWYRHRSLHTDYAFASKGRRKVYMHRLIMDAPSGSVVDHKNRNGLDNRKDNLRLGSVAQNQANSRSRGKLGLRGVFIVKRGNCVRFQAKAGSNPQWRGPKRKDAVQAAIDYDRHARARFGEFATLNFPCVPGRADA